MDSVFANLWAVPSLEESNYQLTLQVTRADTDTAVHDLQQVVMFTTIGPLTCTGWSPYIITDSIPNPGDLLSFKIQLINEGQVTTAEDLEAWLFADHPGITFINSYSSYGDIPAGSTTESNGGYSLQLSSDFQRDTTVYLELEIWSGGHHFWTDSIELSIVTSIDDQKQTIPRSFILNQNYPNPFNPATNIAYQLPVFSQVELSIFNLLGEKVAVLVNKEQPAGYYRVQWDARDISSGVYICQLKTDKGFTDSKKLLLLK
jgi:hypothetical protein